MTPQNKGKAEVTAVLINVNFYLILLVVITIMENVFICDSLAFLIVSDKGDFTF